jgi:diacylglycerol kinase
LKNQTFLARAGFALAGIRSAFQRESSFRVQVAAAALLVLASVVLRPAAIWMAILLLCVALVLGAELINTALEALADGLHPEDAEFVGLAKDCAAAAVLIFSLSAVVVFGLMLTSL